ncbi:uncharacterized protein LOC129716989 [Wyeomyia smithii]|uniref:uncharacterized protein LOC129716989 n=1 Tax=Wyeomyia smithii TaxID=174621 RepID=UPI002467C332|nr:uncharacterized protein LOC129716989 [Wyeomyia smithii]
MSRLKELKDYVYQEYHNLSNNINRPRTRAAVANRRKLLSDAVNDFSEILKEYENSNLTPEHWNRLTDQYTLVQSKVCLALKILNNSAIVPEPNRNRRLSENCLEFETSDLAEDQLANLERSVIFEDPPLSSTLVETQESGEEKHDGERGNRASALEQLEKLEEEFVKKSLQISEVEIQDTPSFGDHIENLKNIFCRSSFIIGKQLNKINMSRAADYVFPKADALQCIPEFRGHKDELEAFLYHVQHFADEIPENGSHSALIYVVLLKLKGKAAAVLPRIKAESWPEVKRNLIKEFGSIENIESVIKRIETLRQEPSEDYSAYKRRTIEMNAYQVNGQGSCQPSMNGRITSNR